MRGAKRIPPGGRVGRQGRRRVGRQRRCAREEMRTGPGRGWPVLNRPTSGTPIEAMSATLSVELPRPPHAAFLARRALDDLAVDPKVLPDVRLLVSELITN